MKRRSPDTAASKCVGVGSGLDALRLGLTASGHRAWSRGDRSGGDVRRDARSRHPGGRRSRRRRRRRRTITALTRARRRLPSATNPRLMPVHLYGQLADMRAPERARRHGRTPSSRMPARRTAQNGTGTAPARQAARPRPSASIPARTSARPGRRSAGDERRGARGAVRALREHGQTRNTFTRGRAGLRASTPFRRSSSRTSSPARRAGTSSGARPPASTPTRSSASAICGCRRCRWELTRSGISTSCARMTRRASRRSCGPRDRHRPALPAPVHLTEAYAELGYRGASSRSPRRSPECSLAADVPGDHRGAARAVVAARRELLRWLIAGQRRALPSDQRRRRSARRPIGPFTNLYGCEIGAEPRSAPSSRFSAARSGAGARSRATPSSAAGSRSTTRPSWVMG